MKQGEKIARNGPCPCGSGKKYKKCCVGTEGASVSLKSRKVAPLSASQGEGGRVWSALQSIESSSKEALPLANRSLASRITKGNPVSK